MSYAFFPGCKIPAFLPQYETATLAVLDVLDVDTVEVEFGCCGDPVRHRSFEAFLLSAAHNLARAESRGLDILTPCKCCYGSLKHAEHWMHERDDLRDRINRALLEDGLQWEGLCRVRHLLTVLDEEVGLEAIRARVKHPQTGLRVAAHYGCHALRPAGVVRLDDPLAPTLFERLVEATGARAVDWSRRLDCCGNPLWEKNEPLSTALMQVKLDDAREAGADTLCTACTHCQIQFDTVQASRPRRETDPPPLPSILYPQLLGQALGVPETELGLSLNRIGQVRAAPPQREPGLVGGEER